jgi:hypothetical protein
VKKKKWKLSFKNSMFKEKPKCLLHNINVLYGAPFFFGMIIRRGEWCCSNHDVHIALYNNQWTLQIQALSWGKG